MDNSVLRYEVKYSLPAAAIVAAATAIMAALAVTAAVSLAVIAGGAVTLAISTVVASCIVGPAGLNRTGVCIFAGSSECRCGNGQQQTNDECKADFFMAYPSSW